MNNKRTTNYSLGLLSLLLLLLAGCANDDVRVPAESGLLVTATPEVTVMPEVTATPEHPLALVPTEWTDDGIKHFPITSVDTDGLDIPKTRQKILTTIQALYPENATIGCCGQDIAAYHQKIMHSFSNLFAHPTSKGIPFDQIADANISVYSGTASTFGPQLLVFSDEYAVISIPNQQSGAGYHRSSPSTYVFDRLQNVYRTNVSGHLRSIQAIDNGFLFHFDTGLESRGRGLAHIIMDSKPISAYSVARFKTGNGAFEHDSKPFTISPDYQKIVITHAILQSEGYEKRAEFLCGLNAEFAFKIAGILVQTEHIRQEGRYVEDKTEVVEVDIADGDDGRKKLDDWQEHCR